MYAYRSRMGGTKHGRNATSRPVYGYHERQRDSRLSKYGTQRQRLGADSRKPLDCCCLTLQPAKSNPTCYPDSTLFPSIIDPLIFLLFFFFSLFSL